MTKLLKDFAASKFSVQKGKQQDTNSGLQQNDAFPVVLATTPEGRHQVSSQHRVNITIPSCKWRRDIPREIPIPEAFSGNLGVYITHFPDRLTHFPYTYGEVGAGSYTGEYSQTSDHLRLSGSTRST